MQISTGVYKPYPWLCLTNLLALIHFLLSAGVWEVHRRCSVFTVVRHKMKISGFISLVDRLLNPKNILEAHNFEKLEYSDNRYKQCIPYKAALCRQHRKWSNMKTFWAGSKDFPQATDFAETSRPKVIECNSASQSIQINICRTANLLKFCTEA